MSHRHYSGHPSHFPRLLAALKALFLQGDFRHGFRIFAGLAIPFEDTVGTAHLLLEAVRLMSPASFLQEAYNNAVGPHDSAASALQC